MKKVFFIVSFVVLLLWVAYLTRDYTLYSTSTHYHANFWVFIDGKRVDFSDDTYMEDIAACKVWVQKSPEDRVHLHENNMGTIHVHDDGVTWWHFFSNIEYNFTSNSLTDDKGNTYSLEGAKKVSFFINGKQVENPFNTQIYSEDVLLVSYWDFTSEEVMEAFFPQVTKDAKEYNSKDDPSSCSGNEYNFFKNLHDVLSHTH